MSSDTFGPPRKRFVEIAVDVPLRTTFHYEWGKPLGDIPPPGARVMVPFGRARHTGFVLREVEEEEVRASVGDRQLREVAYTIDTETLVTPGVLALCRWMSKHYISSLGETLSAALPGGVRKGRKAARMKIVDATADREHILAEAEQATPKRATALKLLAEKRTLSAAELCGGKSNAALVKWIVGRELASVREVLKDPFTLVGGEPDPGFKLTAAQQAALDRVIEASEAAREGNGLNGILLEGVTGSGKTEVYLRAIAREIECGRQAIVLVPEIALTPQTVSRFGGRFSRIAVLHSHLAEGARAEQWRAIHAGEIDVVIGARSAIFAPVPRLGIIVVDEEHESSYKQEASPRYHARDVALARARLEKAVTVLGSATPALESYLAAHRSQMIHLVLPQRIGGRPLPPITVIDMRTERMEVKGYPIVSRLLAKELKTCLDDGHQAILFLNRRGYSTFLHCPRCGEDVHCSQCNVPSVIHKAPRGSSRTGTPDLRCHYCGATRDRPPECPTCGFGKLVALGTGTERVVDEVLRTSPMAKVSRMDSDSMTDREDYERTLGAFRRGEFNVLVGTQMIAKGLDLPRVTLVGVINADVALSMPDFRSSERAFQLIAQVAGRAGRSELGGRVVVQTSLPESLPIRAGSRHDYTAFASEELTHRREFAYPPFTRLARIVVEGPNGESIDKKINTIARILSPETEGELFSLTQSVDAQHSLLGPAEAPLGKLRGRRRQHLIIKAADSDALEALLWENEKSLRTSGSTRVVVDVDPINMR